MTGRSRSAGRSWPAATAARSRSREVTEAWSTRSHSARIVNRALTIKSGQTHVHRYSRPLLDRIRNSEIDPGFVITDRMILDDAPEGYQMLRDRQDECVKMVMRPN